MIQKEYSNTIDFLGEFSQENKLKYLTHRYENDDIDFFDVLEHARYRILYWQGKINKEVYDLVYGFVFGPFWIDHNGNRHDYYCGCEEWVNWCLDNPGLHPMDQFWEEFDAFKNSIRIYNGKFDDYIFSLIQNNKYNGLTIYPDMVSLAKLDAYVNVRRLKKIIEAILSDINDISLGENKSKVTISCKRLTVTGNGVKVDEISILHHDSYPRRPIEEILGHLNAGGGFLATLTDLSRGSAVVSVESSWDNHPLRLILNEEDTPVVEDLSNQEMFGYKYTIRISHRL